MHSENPPAFRYPIRIKILFPYLAQLVKQTLHHFPTPVLKPLNNFIKNNKDDENSIHILCNLYANYSSCALISLPLNSWSKTGEQNNWYLSKEESITLSGNEKV